VPYANPALLGNFNRCFERVNIWFKKLLIAPSVGGCFFVPEKQLCGQQQLNIFQTSADIEAKVLKNTPKSFC